MKQKTLSITANPADRFFKKRNICTLDELWKLYTDPNTSDKDAVKVLLELVQYQYSKMPRAVAKDDDPNKIDREKAAQLRENLLNNYDPNK